MTARPRLEEVRRLVRELESAADSEAFVRADGDNSESEVLKVMKVTDVARAALDAALVRLTEDAERWREWARQLEEARRSDPDARALAEQLVMQEMRDARAAEGSRDTAETRET